MAALQVTILSGATVSDALDLGGQSVVGVFVPSSFTGTAISLQTSADGTTYVAVQDGTGSTYSITVAAGKYVPFDPVKTVGVRYVKLVSGSTELGDRILVLAVRGV